MTGHFQSVTWRLSLQNVIYPFWVKEESLTFQMHKWLCPQKRSYFYSRGNQLPHNVLYNLKREKVSHCSSCWYLMLWNLASLAESMNKFWQSRQMHFVQQEEEFLIKYQKTTFFIQQQQRHECVGGVPWLRGLILPDTNAPVVTHHYTAQGRSFSLSHYHQCGICFHSLRMAWKHPVVWHQDTNFC